MSVECVIKNVAETVGEGPHWEDQTDSLLHVDIHAGDIHRWDSNTRVDEKLHFDDPVSFIIPCEIGGYMISLGKTIAHLDWETKTVTKLIETDPVKKNILNDAKCDKLGRLWTGTIGLWRGSEILEMGTSDLYSFDLNGSIHHQLDGISVSNGMTWNSDNSIMFYTDTRTRRIDAFDYDIENGKIGNRRTAVDFNKYSVEEYGLPDGMTIDTDGKLWVACIGSGKIKCFDPETGKDIRSIDMPTNTPTSCCFGGQNLDELYVTSMRKGLRPTYISKYPLTGSVFKVTGLGVRGLPANIYQG